MANWYSPQLRIWSCQTPVAKWELVSIFATQIKTQEAFHSGVSFSLTHLMGASVGKCLSHLNIEAILDVFRCAGYPPCALRPDSSCSVRSEADLDSRVPQPLGHAATLRCRPVHVLAAVGGREEREEGWGIYLPGWPHALCHARSSQNPCRQTAPLGDSWLLLLPLASQA